MARLDNAITVTASFIKGRSTGHFTDYRETRAERSGLPNDCRKTSRVGPARTLNMFGSHIAKLAPSFELDHSSFTKKAENRPDHTPADPVAGYRNPVPVRDRAAATVARDESAWRAWINAHFPSLSAAGN